jgi:hypothetical protein
MVTRLHGNPRSCPIGTCQRTVRAGQLMCGPHWGMVPKETKWDVYRTWRAWNRTHDADDWETYRVARKAALAAVENANH